MTQYHYKLELCTLIKELNAGGYLSNNNFCSVSLFDRDTSRVFVSPRLDSSFRLTDWSLLRPEDISVVDPGGIPLEELAPVPALELNSHLAIYKERPDINAIAHIQPIHVAAFAAAGVDMRPVMVEDVKTMIGGTDGIIRCAPFRRCYTEEYASTVVNALTPDKKAALLHHNGGICVEKDATEVYSISTILERQALMEIYAKSLGNIDYIDLDMTIDESIRPRRSAGIR